MDADNRKVQHLYLYQKAENLWVAISYINTINGLQNNLTIFYNKIT